MRPANLIIVATFSLLIVGCATNNPQVGELSLSLREPIPPACLAADGKCGILRMPFASDRFDITGNARETTYPAVLQYGVVDAAVPCVFNYPGSTVEILWDAITGKNPENHTNIGEPITFNSVQDFYAEVDKELAKARKNDILLYVHGYDNDFPAVAKRTAIMAFELNWIGSSMFYTWPSKGELTPIDNYLKDEATSEWTEPHLEEFLSGLLSHLHNGQNVYVVVHSMGSRPLTHALADLIDQDNAHGTHRTEHIKQLFMFAGDMDQGVFHEQVLPKLLSAHIKTFIYGSSTDNAISFSRNLHGEPRMGSAGDDDGNPQLFADPGVISIDASDVDLSHSWLGEPGHAYLVESQVVVADVKAWHLDDPGPDWRVPTDPTDNPPHIFKLQSTPSASGGAGRGGCPIERPGDVPGKKSG